MKIMNKDALKIYIINLFRSIIKTDQIILIWLVSILETQEEINSLENQGYCKTI
jgi:hypothetical protein